MLTPVALTSEAEVNDVKKLAKTSPAESVVTGWVAAAKETEPKITH